MKKYFALISITIVALSLCACYGSHYRGESAEEKRAEARIEQELYEYELRKEIYAEAYDEGYRDGYRDAHENINVSDTGKDLSTFYDGIVSLLYDYEFDVVEKLLDYCPEGVEAALELEFGVKDMETIIEYLSSPLPTQKQPLLEMRIEKPPINKSEENNQPSSFTDGFLNTNTVFAMRDQTGLYHKLTCEKLNGQLDGFSIEDAERIGFKPCPLCCGG